jgi:hypothetical protein
MSTGLCPQDVYNAECLALDACFHAIIVGEVWTTEERQMGHTLTLDVPEDVYQSLQQQAEQTGQSPETVAVQLLATATQHQVEDPLDQFIGAFSSQGIDWADRHDAYLGQSVRDTMHHETPEGRP